MNVGREQSLQLPIVVSSGSGTGTVTNVWAIIRWLRVVPINETDTYDITIKDADGLIMLYRTSQLGTFSERIEMSLGIIRTINIANASIDGTYQCRFDLH